MQEERQRIFALTGTIGSGKSAAANIFESLGASLIRADELSREVVEKDGPGYFAVRKHFGESYFLPDGTLDRAKLAQLIFSDAGKKMELEALLHPIIHQLFLDKLARCIHTSTQTPILYDVPLFYEANLPKDIFHEVVVVYATEPQCIERIMKRDNLTREEALRRYSTQIPIDQKRKLADRVIDNTGSLENLASEVRSCYVILKEISKTTNNDL